MDKRLINSINIVNYAIANKCSIKKACVQCGYSNTYVKNTKRECYGDDILWTPAHKELAALIETYSKLKINFKAEPQYDVNTIRTDISTELKKRLKTPITASFETSNINDTIVNNERTILCNTKERIKTVEQLIKECNVNLKEWEIKSQKINKWDTTSFKNGEPKTIENFQVTATLSPIKSAQDSKFVINSVRELISTYKFPELDMSLINPQSPINYEENNLLEIPIFDLHLGKLAWEGETGENYDTKITASRLINVIKTILHRANGYNYNRILFPIGSDFFNSDNLNNTTTKGTPQDEDLRWQKTYIIGVKLMVDAINILKQTGKHVDVLVIPGNHDYERSFYFGVTLESWFRNDESVTFANPISPYTSPRKYYEFGNVLIGFSHGDSEKESSLPILMATEIKEIWGRTKYHEFHMGHIHRRKKIEYKKVETNVERQQSLTEDLGVILRYMPSLTGTEEWHHRRGYIGQIKGAEGYIYNDKVGFIGMVNANVVD